LVLNFEVYFFRVISVNLVVKLELNSLSRFLGNHHQTMYLSFTVAPWTAQEAAI